MSALTGFRVVELAGSVAGEYCGKLLADFGAQVIKVEAAGRGSPTRAMAPVLGDGAGCEGSVLFAYLNTNKQSVALDTTAAADVERLHKLIDTADAVIDDCPASARIRASGMTRVCVRRCRCCRTC
jgi:crotonobetainyl-CoA:carnitine CoA-transferase CaiB-like acyl-CoA transferase